MEEPYVVQLSDWAKQLLATLEKLAEHEARKAAALERIAQVLEQQAERST